jgi:hypothetical protein
MKMYNDDELNPVLYQGKKIIDKYNLSNKIKHIAVMRLSAMGDVAMTVPVLQAFVNQYPEVKITVISVLFSNLFLKG